MSILVAVFSHSAPNKTNNETDNSYKVQALVTKQTKKKKVKNEKCLLVIQKWALEKNY